MGGHAGQTGDAVDMLVHDHEEVKQLFEQFERGSGEMKGDLAQRIFTELQIHAALEEEIFYPAAKRELTTVDLGEGEDKEEFLAISLEEHTSAKELIGALRKMDMNSAEYQERFAELKEDVLSHASEEEDVLFPAAKLKMNLVDLAEQMQERRVRLASSSSQAA